MKKLICTIAFLSVLFFAMGEGFTIAILRPITTGNCTEREISILQNELRRVIIENTGYVPVTRDSSEMDVYLYNKYIEGNNIFNEEAQNSPVKWSGSDYTLIPKIDKERTIDKNQNEVNYNFTITISLIDAHGRIKFSDYKRFSGGEYEYFAIYEKNCKSLGQSLKEKLVADFAEIPAWAYPDMENKASCSEMYSLSRMRLYNEKSEWFISPTFGKNTYEKCAINISLVDGYVKNEQYEDAYMPWEDVYYNCPDKWKTIYIDGEKILKHYIDYALTEEDWEKYFSLLMELYDKWIFYFGNDHLYSRAYIQGKKGEFLLHNSQKIQDKIASYMLLKSAVNDLQESCCLKILYDFYCSACELNSSCSDFQSFDDDFQNVRRCLLSKLENSQDTIKIQSVLSIIETDYGRKRDVHFPKRYANFDVNSLECEETIENDEKLVFYVVEEMPEFPGGKDSLGRYINSNLKYPVIAQEYNIQGKVIVQFTVEKDGSISDVRVVKTIFRTWEWVEGKDGSRSYVQVEKSIGPALYGSAEGALEKEAVRVISSMPRWKPGKQRNKPVRVEYTVPIGFYLQ